VVNKCIFIGHLGSDPEVRTVGDDKKVANFSLAVRSGKEGTEWVRVAAWDRQAEIAEKWLTKGSKAYVEGELRTRSWEDNDGNKRYSTEVIARLLLNLTSKGERERESDDSPLL
jgi:single-strand DNA-binding protein